MQARTRPNLTVALLPAASTDHPYLTALGTALEEAGVGVVRDLPFRLSALLAARTRVDVLHLHWPAYYYLSARGPAARAAALCWYAAKLLVARAVGYRVVWTAHNLLPHDLTRGGSTWAARMDRWCLVRAAHAVICHCRAARTDLALALGRRRGVWVIPHGPLWGAPEGGAVTRKAARAFLRVPEGIFLYVYVGEIRPYKGVEDLLAVFPADAADSALLVAGAVRDEGLRGRIQRKAARHPSIRTFLRRVPEHRMSWLLKAADAVVLPYRRVTTSGLLHLAMAHGARIVAPAMGCIPEAVDGRFAVLYHPSDLSGLGRALKRIRDFDPEGAAIGARERAEECGWDRIGAATRDVYLAPTA